MKPHGSGNFPHRGGRADHTELEEYPHGGGSEGHMEVVEKATTEVEKNFLSHTRLQSLRLYATVFIEDIRFRPFLVLYSRTQTDFARRLGFIFLSAKVMSFFSIQRMQITGTMKNWTTWEVILDYDSNSIRAPLLHRWRSLFFLAIGVSYSLTDYSVDGQLNHFLLLVIESFANKYMDKKLQKVPWGSLARFKPYHLDHSCCIVIGTWN
nr:hypothetical protein CFP56_44819 [Quercus suber]